MDALAARKAYDKAKVASLREQGWTQQLDGSWVSPEKYMKRLPSGLMVETRDGYAPWHDPRSAKFVGGEHRRALALTVDICRLTR